MLIFVKTFGSIWIINLKFEKKKLNNKNDPDPINY